MFGRKNFLRRKIQEPLNSCIAEVRLLKCKLRSILKPVAKNALAKFLAVVKFLLNLPPTMITRLIINVWGIQSDDMKRLVEDRVKILYWAGLILTGVAASLLALILL